MLYDWIIYLWLDHTQICISTNLCRYNKRIKNLCRDMSHPEAHLAKSSTQDASASFVNLAMHDYDISTSMHHKCVLSVPKQNWYATEEEFADLALRYGCEQDQFSIRCFAVAHVFAVHFRAKEWLKYPRCGSVVTCVMDGQSYYARVEKFFCVGDDCSGYASVVWFGKPSYPLGTPMVVKVSEDGSHVKSEYGCIISLDEIDPSRVMVEFSNEPSTYYVMRDSGYDTIKK